MKGKYFIIIFTTIILNMYVLFIWNPYNTEDIAVNSYKDNSNILDDSSNYKEAMNYSDTNLHESDNELEKETFYLDQDESLESLDDKDIEELNRILNKLSTSDLSKWLDFKNSEDNDKLIEFFKLINKRMNREDYKKIKSIMGKVLDMDKIESIANNNYE